MLRFISYLLFLPLRFFSAVGDWVTRWGRGIEGLFFGTLRASDRIGGNARWLDRTLAAIAWPLVALIQWLDFSPRARRHRTVDAEAEDQRVRRKLQRTQSREDFLTGLKQSWAGRMLWFVIAPPAMIGGFLISLLLSRKRGVWVWSLPLLCILGLLAFVYYQVNFVDTQRIAARYQAAMAKAIQAGDQKQVDLFRSKLEQLGARTQSGDYRTALALAEAGQWDEAYEKMQEIAPLDGAAGMAAAHFWIAQYLVEGRWEVPANEALSLALQHLEQMKTRSGKQAPVQFLEGLIYARQNRADAAENALQAAADELPAAAGLLLEIHLAQGNLPAARNDAITLQRHLNQMRNEGGEFTEVHRRWQTQAAQVLGDPQAVRSAVADWYRANPDSPAARLNQGSLLLLEVDRWLEAPRAETVPQIQQQLVQAAELIPGERFQLLHSRLFPIWKGRISVPVLGQLFEGLMADERLSGRVLEFFGTNAAVAGDWEAADRWLGLASERSPEWALAWNNRAFVLSQAYPERWEEGLGYVDRAIVLDGTNAEYRETRGMLRLKLKQWQGASEDLQLALNALPLQSPRLHQALAVAYENLGNRRLADIHSAAAKTP